MLERDLDVISTHLLGGRTVVHVYASERPAPGFEPVDAGLEDVYFLDAKARGRAARGVMFGEIFRFELRYQAAPAGSSGSDARCFSCSPSPPPPTRW